MAQRNRNVSLKPSKSRAALMIIHPNAAGLDWVVERQCVKTDKDSGIVSDANDWAADTMNDPKYPLDLIGKVVAVALGTRKIVCSLARENRISW